MKVDTSGIDKEKLALRVNAEYSLSLTSLTFLPEGEEAFTYVGVGRDGTPHFIRAQPTTETMALEHALAVTDALHGPCGIQPVVAPYQSVGGAYVDRYDGFAVAVFPFIDGLRAFEHPLSSEGIEQAASLVAAIHRSHSCLTVPLRRTETFENPFEAPIRRVLQAAEGPNPGANEYQRRVRRLLRAERADILAALKTMEALKAAALALELDWVVTHGDPNLANILVDKQGNLHLVDWTDVAIGPPERDLIFFTGERFELFLRHYVAAFGKLRLHDQLFAFYEYRWAFQEIADYSTRVLFRNVSPIEDRHAWAELTEYLPIRHVEIAGRLREIVTVSQRVLTSG